MKNTIFISVIVCLLLVGFPSKNFAGNCSAELIFQPKKTTHTIEVEKSRTTVVEKVATWVLKKKLKKANKHQKLQKDDFEKRADRVVALGALSIFIPFLSIFAIIFALEALIVFKKKNGTKKHKVAAWVGLILGLIGLGVLILLAPAIIPAGG
jgi:hypothetical protein